MDVPKGYKQTEVGVIPEDWKTCQLGDLVTLGLIAKPLDGNHGNIHPKSSDFVYDGIPFIMANNVSDGSVDIESCSFIRKEQADNLQKGFSFSGDVLLTHKGTVGNVAIVGEINTEYVMLTPQVTYYRTNDNSRLSREYIKSFFESTLFQPILKSKSGSGTRAYIGITKQKELPFVLPPPEEQTAIATTLSDVDALISSLTTLTEKKRQIKTATMQRLLTGKQRLPGFGEGKGMQQTELGEIPEDWEVVNLGSIARIKRGASPRPIDSPKWFDSNSKVGWLRISDVTKSNKYLVETIQNLSKLGIAHSRPVSTGALVMSICATVGRPIIIEKEICIHDGFVVFEGLKIDTNLAYYILQELEKSWGKQGQTGSQMNLNTDLINSTQIILSNDEYEQRSIGLVLSNIDINLATLETRLAKTKALKQGMMQELLTGRTRLV